MPIAYPLTKANRLRLARAFREVPRVDIAIDCVIEDHMGTAFVDKAQQPTAFKIMVGPFTYFAGDINCPGGQEIVETLSAYTYLMAASPGWFEAIVSRYGERAMAIERYSFASTAISIPHLDHLCQTSPFQAQVKKMDAAFAASLWGQRHFVDFSDFDSPEDWAERGIGFYLAENDNVIGAAYSSLVCNGGIEVSIFVMPDYRRQGMATVLAASLVKWCLEHNQDAHWDAANEMSCKLAEKLGYVATGSYRAYYLKDK